MAVQTHAIHMMTSVMELPAESHVLFEFALRSKILTDLQTAT